MKNDINIEFSNPKIDGKVMNKNLNSLMQCVMI